MPDCRRLAQCGILMIFLENRPGPPRVTRCRCCADASSCVVGVQHLRAPWIALRFRIHSRAMQRSRIALSVGLLLLLASTALGASTPKPKPTKAAKATPAVSPTPAAKEGEGGDEEEKPQAKVKLKSITFVTMK